MANHRPTTEEGLLLRDLRDPAEPMRQFTLKLPRRMIESIDQCAAAYHVPRSSLVRTLLAEGLERLASGN